MKGALLSGLGWLLLGLASWRAGVHFAGEWAPLGRIGVIFLCSFSALAATSLISPGRASPNPWVADICDWVASSPARNFWLAGLVASYFLFLRPYLVGKTSFVGLIEWGIVLLLAWRLFEEVKFRLESEYTLQLFFSPWRRHAQAVEERRDEHLLRIRMLEQEFVERGEKSPLLGYLQEVLAQNRWPSRKIEELLRPLREYRGDKAPRFSLPGRRRRLRLQELRNRQGLLEELMHKLEREARR